MAIYYYKWPDLENNKNKVNITSDIPTVIYYSMVALLLQGKICQCCGNYAST
jgi:hypothetical protein